MRKPKILWVSRYCLLDTTSGASMSVYEMLKRLNTNGWDVKILGATIFDSERGKRHLEAVWDQISNIPEKLVEINDLHFEHTLIVTASTHADQMTLEECNIWYHSYIALVDTYKPDIVFFYGGSAVDYLIASEARARRIPSATYLVNANYNGVRWVQDVDVVITDTQATSDFYYNKDSFKPVPVGKFIDPARVTPKLNSRTRLLFVNPAIEKGAGIVVQLALLLEQARPEIKFEVVESRGSWSDVVRQVTAAFGEERSSLNNVIVTPNTSDVREFYKNARVLLLPSLWWESGSRALAEAMLNGIPAILTDYGGNNEMVADAGIFISLPIEYHQKPFNRLPNIEELKPVMKKIIELYDNEDLYQSYVNKAYASGRSFHQIERSTERLLAAFKPLVDQRAGDNDFSAILQNAHKHKLNSLNLERSSKILAQQRPGQTSDIKKFKNGTVEKRITSTLPGLLEREVFWLTKFAGCGAPKLLSWSASEKKILMSDVGKPLTQENIPNDWEEQLQKILENFAEKKCRHNDLTPEEICVSNGRLSVVDFGWASIGHDLSCGGRAPLSSKERLYIDEDAFDRVRFKFRKDFSATDFICCFSWGNDEITRAELVQRGAVNIQSFQMRGSLLHQVKQRLKGSFLEHLEERGAFEAGSLLVSVCIFDQSQDIFSQCEMLNTKDFHERQLYLSKNLSEAREMINAVTYFYEEYPYVLWRQWWNGAFEKAEIAGAEFQDKRQGIQKRWDCISNWLNENSVRSGTTLDIGSNLGDSCIRLSSAGFKVIGVEPDLKVYRDSLSRTTGGDIKIYNTEANADFFRNFSGFDLVLALSVLHRVWALKGRSEAESILRMAAEKTNFIVIEGACSLDRFNGKYGDLPAFFHNDIPSSTSWHLNWLAGILSSEWRLDYIGLIPHTSSEPFRILFGARKIPTGKHSAAAKRGMLKNTSEVL